jgi:hypothetical protein
MGCLSQILMPMTSVRRHPDGTSTVDLGGDHQYRVDVRDVDGVPSIVSLTISAVMEADGETLKRARNVRSAVITRDTLRAVPLARIARMVAANDAGQWLKAAQTARREDPRRRLTDEFLEEVLAFIAEAKQRRIASRAAAAETWFVSVPTIDSWLREARKRGLNAPDLRKGAGS